MYVCLFVSRHSRKAQSLNSDVGVGKKVRGQCLVQCSAHIILLVFEGDFPGKQQCEYGGVFFVSKSPAPPFF